MMPPLFLSPKVWHHFPVPSLLCAREGQYKEGDGGERWTIGQRPRPREHLGAESKVSGGDA